MTWDLSAFDGINIHLLTPSSSLPSEDDDKGDKAEGKGKVYTFILKDSLPETYVEESTGRTREKSTVSWECDFRVPKTSSKEEREGTGDREEKVISIPWRDFKPTYRGKEVKDAEPLDLEGVRRMSLMMRRYVILFWAFGLVLSMTLYPVGIQRT